MKNHCAPALILHESSYGHTGRVQPSLCLIMDIIIGVAYMYQGCAEKSALFPLQCLSAPAHSRKQALSPSSEVH